MSLEDDLRNLSRIPIFAAIEADARRLIAFSAETRILRAGDVLFRRGDPSDCGYILMSGAIALDTRDDGSSGSHVVSPYTLIGELALISETERPTTAIARQPSTVLKVSRHLFHRVLREYPESAAKLRDLIGARLNGMLAELDRTRPNWS